MKKILTWLLGKAEEAAPALKLAAVKLVLEAEKKLGIEGATGAEKKAWVVAKLDEAITLPWWLEPFDGPLFALLADIICVKINDAYGHSWVGVTIKKAVKAVDEA